MMKANTIMLNNKDNVVTATCNIKKGETIAYLKDDKMLTIMAVEDIPIWNKAAITSINNKGFVIKYGETIGAAVEDITEGSCVSHLNIVSLPRDYTNEMK
ncbi:UxaA family hydrolase [Sporosalibacterium faouarense]|uniref:UxaA family hydrolase n=1 Tax=Sporosalibacterium faouarense TaxID=516123 RepID=UPI00141D527D|nr:UxaA family hydrolase [Sporosalibacterium faouarense]MTI47179.1 hydrolase [Bacillota bacterium]